jgi:hypothetical protein
MKRLGWYSLPALAVAFTFAVPSFANPAAKKTLSVPATTTF